MDKAIDLRAYIQELKSVSYGTSPCRVCLKANEGFMLRNKIWKQVVDYHKIDSSALVCLKCSHTALGRNFILDDFTDCPLNQGVFVFDSSLFVLIQEYYYEAK